MSDTTYKKGDIVKAKGHYTKILSVRNGLYGISGWATLTSAKKATRVHRSLNKHGFRNAGAVVVSKGAEEVTEETETTEDTRSAKELKAILKEAGLKVSGKIDELRARVQELESTKDSEDDSEEDEETETPDGDEEETETEEETEE